MKKIYIKYFVILAVVALLLTFSTGVLATNEYNINADFDSQGKEIVDICDLVAAEKQSKADSFVLQLQRILLEVEDLPAGSSRPTSNTGIYLPIVP